LSEPTVPAQNCREGPRCLQHPAQVQLVGADFTTLSLVHLPLVHLPTRPAAELLPTDETSRPCQEVPQQRWFWQKVFELLNGGAEALIFLCSSSTSSYVLLLLHLGVFQGLVKPSLLLGQEGQRSSKKLNTLGQFPHSREWSGKESGTTNGSQQYGWSSVEACIEETTNDEADTGCRGAGIQW